MKYTTAIEINLPRERVIELFDNPNNLKKWMKDLQSFEAISGIPGQVGAKSRLRFKMGAKEVEFIETITVRNLPREFSGTYESKGVWSETKNYFEDLGNNKTKLISENEFRFNGFMKLLAWLMPGMFKKQSEQYLQAFKSFAEKADLSVSNQNN